MVKAQRLPVVVQAGTNPIPDATNLQSLSFVETDKVRFYHGQMRKLGGWTRVLTPNLMRIIGAARTIYSYRGSDGLSRYLIGTDQGLYAVVNGAFYNITPLETTSVAVGNNLNNQYLTLTDPFTTTNGSNIIKVNAPNHNLASGFTVKFSGASTFNGINASQLNVFALIRSVVDANNFTIQVASNATASGSGGGTVTMSSGQIIISQTAHGYNVNDRIKISGSTDVGGITAPQINIENTIYSVINANSYAIMTTGYATSEISSGGGTGAIVFHQITPGAAQYRNGQGYGGGLYGMGLYGTARQFINGFQYPCIWSIDRAGNNDIAVCPGNGKNVYIWTNSDLTTAPTILTNAPTKANWVFVSNKAVGILGSNGNNNEISFSDVNNATIWTPSPSNLAINTTINGAGKFLSVAKVRDVLLLFTENQIYQARFVNAPDVWDIKPIFNTDGIISPQAFANVEDAVYWMGKDSFYKYERGLVTNLLNTTTNQYIFTRLNWAAFYHCFAFHNNSFNEVWFFYPSLDSLECNEYVIYNYQENHWTTGTMNRSAAEKPSQLTSNPYLIESFPTDITKSARLFMHENGVNDYLPDTQNDPMAMNCSASTNYGILGNGDTTVLVDSIIPDSIQAENLNITVNTKLQPQDVSFRTFGPYTITPSTSKIDIFAHGRQRQYVFGSNSLDSDFKLGRWFESLKPTSQR